MADLRAQLKLAEESSQQRLRQFVKESQMAEDIGERKSRGKGKIVFMLIYP